MNSGEDWDFFKRAPLRAADGSEEIVFILLLPTVTSAAARRGARVAFTVG